MRKFKVQANGKAFSENINGTLENPTLEVEVYDVKPFIGNKFLVTLYYDTDVRWTDNYGESHTQHLLHGSTIIIDKEFLVA